MKKTPKDLSSSPLFIALNTVVAATALTGIAAKSVPTVNASDLSYDTQLQKSVGSQADVDMRTFTTVDTASGTFPRQTDDSKTTTDQF